MIEKTIIICVVIILRNCVLTTSLIVLQYNLMECAKRLIEDAKDSSFVPPHHCCTWHEGADEVETVVHMEMENVDDVDRMVAGGCGHEDVRFDPGSLETSPEIVVADDADVVQIAMAADAVDSVDA